MHTRFQNSPASAPRRTIASATMPASSYRQNISPGRLRDFRLISTTKAARRMPISAMPNSRSFSFLALSFSGMGSALGLAGLEGSSYTLRKALARRMGETDSWAYDMAMRTGSVVLVCWALTAFISYSFRWTAAYKSSGPLREEKRGENVACVLEGV